MDNITEKINLLNLAQSISTASTDSFYAVHSSDIEPLPHQIMAVYHEMLSRSPLRYLLADDPGAGKTIMTGLFIKELFIRNKLNSCLIVSPGPLAEQWQNELDEKFHMDFIMLTDDSLPNFCIARLDTISRNKDLQQKITAKHWDIVVIDEAHKLSAQDYGTRTYYTKRFQLGRALSESAENFLLLTATPNNGKPKDFRHFMSLLGKNISQDSMRRLLKEDLLNFECSPLFPEREAFTVSYKLSEAESELYEKVTDYVRSQFKLAEALITKRRNSVGFALTILQRRLASSPEAIYQSLSRRLQKLQERFNDARLREYCVDYDEDDYTSGAFENAEDYAVSYVSASKNVRELTAEINTLKTLLKHAEDVRTSGQDRKWSEISRLLQENSLFFTPADQKGRREKLIIFTEHKDTLNYLAEKIRNLLGRHDAVTEIHGSMSQSERRKSVELFTHSPETQILIATDAAGEGINLQCARLMINYDLPWNPNRLEQRFGRIHRIGQQRTCYLWNLVAENTREGSVFRTLLTKLEEERKALGGKVYDILGRITIGSKDLHTFLIEAVRFGTTYSFTSSHHQIKTLLNERSLNHSSITQSDVQAILQALQESESHMLKPEIVKSFILCALPHLGGSIYQRGKNTYEITYIPKEIRIRDPRIKKSYSRIAFEKNSHAEVIIKGHPLLEAMASLILEKYHDLLTDIQNTTQEGRESVELAAMLAVMNIERKLGNSPRDVSAEKCGYDIESLTPKGTSRFIEVKGRRAGADTITITAGEIRSAIMNPEKFILAIVNVDGEETHTMYLKHKFTHEPDPEAVGIIFSISTLVINSSCIYRE